MAEANVGDITARLRVDTSEWQRSLQNATRQVQDFGQKTQQTQQQLSQLPFTAIQNATEQFSRAILNAGNSQDRMRQAITQAQQALAQFNVTVDAGGRMTDRFGQVLSSGTADALRQFRIGVREAQAELAQFQRFGINAAGAGGGAGGGILQQMLGVAGGIGIATTLQGLVTAVRNFAVASVQLSGAMQDLHRSFVALEGSGSQATRTLRDLFQLSQQAGVGFQTTAEGFRRLEAGAKGTTLEGQGVREVFTDITLGARALGLSTNQTENAFRALEQMLTKGVLSAEELVRQLGNAMPGGLERMAKGLGVTTVELRTMAESGLLPATVGITALAAEMRKYAETAGPIAGFTASFERLSNITGVWQTSLGNTLNDTLIPIMDTLTRILTIAGELANLKMTPENFVPGWLRGLLDLRGLFTAKPVGETPEELQRMQGARPGGLPIAPSAYTPQIEAAAARYGVDPGLVSQVARVESRFRPEAQSPAGAVGLMQVMQQTAQGLRPGITREQMFEPGTNLALGTQYLAQMLERFKHTEDQVRLALTAYHSGPGTVERLLGEAEQRGLPQTLAGISRIPASRGGLGPAGRAYAEQVLEAPTGTQATQATAAMARTTEQWKKELDEVNGQYDRLAERAKALAGSTDDYNGILRNQVAQQLQSLVDRYVKIASYVAVFPEQAQALGEGVRQEISERTQDAAILQQQLLGEAGRRDLLRQQVEQMEALISRQKAQLIGQREGQEAAEQFARLDAARRQAEQLAERPVRAGMTLNQQITQDANRLQALQNEAAQLSSELEARRVEAMRPQLESQLQGIEAFLGRSGQSQAEQARQQVLTRGAAAQAQLVKLIQETARHPALQDLQEAFQNAFQALPEAVERQSENAFAAVERQMRETLRGMEDQLDQISQRTGAAGLSPFEADLARIRREAARTTDQLEAMVAALEKLRLGATPEAQQAIDAMVGRVKDVQAGQGEALNNALLERQERDGKRLIEQAEARLAQMRELPGTQGFPFGQPREVTQLRREAAKADMTDEQRETLRLTEEQMLAQDKLNFAVGIWYDLSQSIGQAWSQSLMSVIDGTMSVSQAFEAMGKAILKTMADIAAQQATMALFQLGAGLLTGALTGAVTPAAGGGASGLGSSSSFIGTQLAPQASFAFTAQHGAGPINAPTMILAGEGHTNPEWVLNNQQMQSLMTSAVRSGSSANGQQSQVSIHNYPSKAAAEQGAAQQRGQGHQVIVNAVLEELSIGESSRINRAMRSLQR